MKLRTLIVALLVFPVGLIAQTSPSEPAAQPENSSPAPDAAQDLQKKQEQLKTVTKQIDQIQTRAEASETVKKSKAEYEETLKAEMVRAAPEMETAIERRSQLVSELSNIPSTEQAAPTEQQTEKLREFRNLRDQLLTVEQKAESAEAVRTARSNYFKTLVAEMNKIDPKTDELLRLHHDLSSALGGAGVRRQS